MIVAISFIQFRRWKEKKKDKKGTRGKKKRKMDEQRSIKWMQKSESWSDRRKRNCLEGKKKKKK